MTMDYLGALRPISLIQELTGLDQGADMAIIPAAWAASVHVDVATIAIFALVTPSNQHSFTFFQTDGSTTNTMGAVTMTTSGHFWTTAVTPGAGSFLKGQTHWVTVRHDTNGQDADEMAGAHVTSGSRLWAILIPSGLG